MGFKVILAARLMQAAAGSILCEELVHNAAISEVDFEVMKPIALKGVKAKVPVFRPMRKQSASAMRKTAQLLGLSVNEMRDRRRGGRGRHKLGVGGRGFEDVAVNTEMVGRDAEMKAMAKCLDECCRATDPSTQLEGDVDEWPSRHIIVKGDPGIGKSVLCFAFLEKLRYRQMEYVAAKGEIRETDDYYVWRCVLQDLLGIKETDNLNQRQALVRVALEQLKAWIETRLRTLKQKEREDTAQPRFDRHPFTFNELSKMSGGGYSEANSPRGLAPHIAWLFNLPLALNSPVLIFVLFLSESYVFPQPQPLNSQASLTREQPSNLEKNQASVSGAKDKNSAKQMTFLSLLPPAVNLQRASSMQEPRMSHSFGNSRRFGSVHGTSDGKCLAASFQCFMDIKTEELNNQIQFSMASAAYALRSKARLYPRRSVDDQMMMKKTAAEQQSQDLDDEPSEHAQVLSDALHLLGDGTAAWLFNDVLVVVHLATFVLTTFRWLLCLNLPLASFAFCSLWHR